jgi:uncharacterized membrane-anchored protein YhcB (DUF1043 family)
MVVDSIINGVVFLIEELGIFAVGATVIGWVAKDVINQYFEKELNKYQAEIDKELSRFQAELDKEKLQFSQLHNERARITAELYEKFILFEEDMRSLTDPMERGEEPPKDEKLQTAAESGNEFINFYMKNKIYFPPEICDTIEDLHEEMKSVYNQFGIYKPYESRPGDPQDPGEWLEMWKRVTEDDVPELKEELENHFRELLGVDMEQQND